MNDKEFCYICGDEISEGEKVTWRTSNGILTVCKECDETIDVEAFIEEKIGEV